MRDTTKVLMEMKNAAKYHERKENTHTQSVLEQAEERICYMNDLLEMAVEELENIYGRETELTQKIRDVLIDETDKDYQRKDKPNWVIHLVASEEGEPEYLADTHTHGLEVYGHPNLTLVLSLPSEVSCSLLNSIGMRIKNGESFDKDGTIYTDILANNLPVMLVKKRFGKEENMVLVLPDENGNLPGNIDCKFPYNMQFEYMEYIKKNRY